MMDAEATYREACKGRTLFLCTHSAGGATGGYIKSLLPLFETCADLGLRLRYAFSEDHANNARARCLMVAAGLAISDVTDFLFIDTDISWDGEAFLRMLPPVARGEIPILTGTQQRRGFKDDEPEFAWRPAAKGSFEANAVGYLRCDGATAFMRVEREVFEGIAAKRPDLKWDHDGLPDERRRWLYGFFNWNVRTADEIAPDAWAQLMDNPHFDEMVLTAHFASTGERLPAKLLKDADYRERTARELAHIFTQGAGHRAPLSVSRVLEGEDYGFCRLARECGYETWTDPMIRLGHQDKRILNERLIDHLPPECEALMARMIEASRVKAA